jgi:hypothetical protein
MIKHLDECLRVIQQIYDAWRNFSRRIRNIFVVRKQITSGDRYYRYNKTSSNIII